MKKVNLLFLSLVCLFATIQQAYGYTAAEAFQIAKDSCGAQYDYYVGTTLHPVSINNAIRNIRYNVVLVDLMPKAGWNHPCKLVYVPVDTNDAYPIEIIDADCPPANVSFNPALVHRGRPGITRIRPSVSKIQSNASDTAAAYASQHTYALIISGGVTKNLNHYRYWNDCSFIYQTLRNRFDIPKSHIKVAMSDGTYPAPDLNVEGTYYSSPLDLDEDGQADIEYAATKSNISSILSAFADSLTENDHLFIYVIDHGGLDAATNRSYISLWQFERLYSNELADMLSEVNAGFINVVMGQCHSGGFAEDLKANGRVITTACGKDELSYACEDIPFDEFVYRWTSAINGADAFGNTVNSDANSDGIVTMEEAFAYADANDIYAHGRHSIVQETPDTCSYTLSVVEDLAFNRIPELVDLYMRDYRDDTGAATMRNGSLAFPINKWNTHDIWLRNNNDGYENQTHENVEFTEDDDRAYIYVKVRNRGTKPYLGSGQYVNVYWANSAIGLTFKNWAGMLSDNNKRGGGVGFKEITSTINPGDSAVVMVKWTLSDGLYDEIYNKNNDRITPCLLAVISNRGNLGVIPIDVDSIAKVWDDNNIVQRNNVLLFNKNEIDMELSNDSIGRQFDLVILDSYRPISNNDDAEISITLPRQAYNGWLENGEQSSCLERDPNINNMFHLQDTICILSDILVSDDNSETIRFRYNYLANEAITETKHREIDLLLRDRMTGQYIGGETFTIGCNPRAAISTDIVAEETNIGYSLSVSEPSEDLRYEWYNTSGILIGSGSSIDVPSNISDTYTVKSIAVSDGAVSYSNVSLQKVDAIESVSVKDDVIQVSLRHETSGPTYLILSCVDNSVQIFKRYTLSRNTKLFNIPTSGLSYGVYQVSLIKNNETLDSKKVLLKI